MTQYDESPTIFMPEPRPVFDTGCVNCGKPVGLQTADGITVVTSADRFCSVECRRDWHLRDGCDRCGEVRPSSIDEPGWKFGGFMFYGDTEIVCPRCIV